MQRGHWRAWGLLLAIGVARPAGARAPVSAAPAEEATADDAAKPAEAEAAEPPPKPAHKKKAVAPAEDAAADAAPAEKPAEPAPEKPAEVQAAPAPTPPKPAVARKAGDVAPTFFLPRVNPSSAKTRVCDLAAYVGESPKSPRKAVLISFFSSTSRQSLKELPMLLQLAEKYGTDGLQVIAVSTDKNPDDIAKLPDLLKAKEITFPVVGDPLNLLATRYFGNGFKTPGIVFIWADGTIGSLRQGYEGDTPWIETDVRLLLGLPSDGSGKKKGTKKAHPAAG